MHLDQISRGDGILVLPDSKDRPACITKHHVNLAVTPHVPINFLNPVINVATRLPVVQGAPMPETSVNENGHFYSGEHHISGTPDARQRPSSYSIPKAAPVQDRSDNELRHGVPTPIALHRLAGSGGGHEK